ncbi:hypothetical protein U1839_16320 [Sphingomonas sp. RT2P30]
MDWARAYLLRRIVAAFAARAAASWSCLVTSALAIALFPSVAKAQASAPALGFFSWQLDRMTGHRVTLVGAEETDRILLDLIRADVDVRLATSNRIEMVVRTDAVEGIERVTIRADASAKGIRILDAYPQRSGWSAECLPPPTEHGDFWLVPVRLKVTLFVPARITVDVTVREGTVEDLRHGKRWGLSIRVEAGPQPIYR